MNAEQKAFYEYGEARGILKERKSLMRFTEGYGECSDYHGEPRIMYGVEDAIRDAWQKRAACRAWAVEERYCCICAHGPMNLREKVCWTCIHHHHWEPRKEGES